MKFEELKFEDIDTSWSDGTKGNGIQAWVDLPNGIKVSVVKHSFSLGHHEGLYEMAALHKGHIIIIDEWDDGVKGNLDEKGVEKELNTLSLASDLNYTGHERRFVHGL